MVKNKANNTSWEYDRGLLIQGSLTSLLFNAREQFWADSLSKKRTNATPLDWRVSLFLTIVTLEKHIATSLILWIIFSQGQFTYVDIPTRKHNYVWLRTTQETGWLLLHRVFNVMHLLHNFAILGEKLKQKQMTNTWAEIVRKHSLLGACLWIY